MHLVDISYNGHRVIGGIKTSNIGNIIELSFDLDFNMYIQQLLIVAGS